MNLNTESLKNIWNTIFDETLTTDQANAKLEYLSNTKDLLLYLLSSEKFQNIYPEVLNKINAHTKLDPYCFLKHGNSPLLKHIIYMRNVDILKKISNTQLEVISLLKQIAPLEKNIIELKERLL
jgi:hypothetical protein